MRRRTNRSRWTTRATSRIRSLKSAPRISWCHRVVLQDHARGRDRDREHGAGHGGFMENQMGGSRSYDGSGRCTMVSSCSVWWSACRMCFARVKVDDTDLTDLGNCSRGGCRSPVRGYGYAQGATSLERGTQSPLLLQELGERPRSVEQIDPRRQGPVAALQVQGSAKELVREITPQQLRDGGVDQLTGQHLTGLMLLVTVLARRYAVLDAENSTKAIREFLGFRWMPGETVDGVLVRYEVLRIRATQQGGFNMGHSGLSWLLLQALQISPDGWERLLAPLHGALPQDEGQFNALIERVRRSGHVREGRHQQGAAGANGDPGNYLAYPNDPWLPGGGGDPWSGYRTTGNYHMDPNMGNFPGPAGGDQNGCPTCGSYAAWNDDDGNSTNTSTDDEAPLDDPEANMTVEDAYQAYVFARKRWRRFAQKPRRYRNKRSYASFLPPGAFAGGKGKSGGGGRIGHGKGKSGGFSRKNPKNKDGMIMKCHRCGSDEHLIKKCPMPDGGGQGHMHAAEKRPALALTAMDPRSWSSGGLLPGVAFHTQARSTVSKTSFVNLELDKLRSVSQAGSEVSYAASRKRPEQSSVISTPRRVRQARDGTPPAPTWSPGATMGAPINTGG